MIWRHQKIAVIGGSGCLGRAIIRQLLIKGCKIKSFQRSPAPEYEELGVKVVRGDVRNIEQLRVACRGCTGVIHTAALAGYWGSYKDYFSINVEGTLNVLAVCQDFGIDKLVFTSSTSVAYNPDHDVLGIDESEHYPDHYLAHYCKTKAIAEKNVMGAYNRSLSAVCLRPHLIWGPGDNHLLPEVIRRARRKILYQVGDGSNMIDLAYVDNVAWAHVLALEFLQDKNQLRKIYFITDGVQVNMWDWIARLLKNLGEPGISGQMSVERAWKMAKFSEAVYKYLPFQPAVTRFLAGHFGHSHYFNISAAERDLGYVPRVPPATAMSDTLEWLKKY